jgi:hypothetical protein
MRDVAVVYLNMLYDDTNWQEKTAFNPKIKNVGDSVNFEYYIRKKDYEENAIILITNLPKNEDYHIEWTKASNVEEVHGYLNVVKLIFKPEKLQRCGYFDWNLVKFKNGQFTTIKKIKDLRVEDELEYGKGRYIVVDKSIKDLSVHEVFVDQMTDDPNKRGTFENLEAKLDEFNQRYVNCLYIMGALERDNQIITDGSEVVDIGNKDASPMAVTCRATISKLLGGDKAFNSLISKAKKFSMKIFIDSLSRISSSHHHRKYRNILLHTLDQSGKANICYGSDGHSVNYEDSAILNYRKVESWDLLLEDIIHLASKHKIDGIHLDNCQAWPQIMKINEEELFRLDPDGQPAYNSMEILDGIIVSREESGYWQSDMIEDYPNPFLIKLTKEIWKIFPYFAFIGESWGTLKFHNRHIVLARSGIIPRMYTLPRALSSVFGRRIHRNGYIETAKPSSVNVFKEMLEENNQYLPEGGIVIQSSSGQVWPYPALLYGRGNWSAVDLLFTLPDIPMTFMDEINGQAYRVQITNVYEHREVPKNLMEAKRSKSFVSLDYDEVNEFVTSNGYTGSKSSSELKEFQKVKSLMSISGVSTKDKQSIKAKQDMVIKEVGPEFGFDLTKIKFHYDHRRKMRSIHESLRRGTMVYLDCFDNNNEQHQNIFAFARHCPEETGIIAINFSNTAVKSLINYLAII